MRILKVTALFSLLLLAASGLSGCSQAQQVESQAFVLAMGVDLTEDGRYELTARMPRVAGDSTDTEGAGSGSDYLNISAVADDYESALDTLGCITPRSLNLSQLKLIAFSEEIAKDGKFRSLIEEISQTERLFTAARVVVCKGRAKEFVDALEPAFGTRLSKALSATFDHFETLGTVPASSLADLCYRTESFYSDPMTAFAQTGMPGEIDSDIPVSYLGAALFTEGRLAGTFDNEESRIVSLIKGTSDSVWYVLDGRLLRLSQNRAPRIEIYTDENPMRIRISFALTISAREGSAETERLEDRFRQDVREAIRHAQRMHAEPFGFAESAAGHFRTIDEYIQYDFRKRYELANIEILLRINEMSA